MIKYQEAIMPDKVNKNASATLEAVPATKPRVISDQPVSLVEMIMILMLVGLLFVFFFGMKQLKVDKALEAAAQEKFEAVVPTYTKLVKAMEEYQKKDQFGDYPAFLEELNIGNLDSENFKFTYVFDTLTITATSTKAFGKEGVKVNYSLSDRSYTVDDPTPEKKPTVKDDWLPQE